MIQFILIFLSSFTLFSEEIVVTIEPNTFADSLDWNDSQNPILAKVGDTLVIVNNDSESHQLHTPGRPCKHGEPILPSESWSCVLESEYNYLDESEPLRDHMNYTSKFWLIVESADRVEKKNDDKD